MSIIVKKFGGTSVATPEKIKRAAEIVANAKRSGDDVAVVISAMGNTTDVLVSHISQFNVNTKSAKRERDAVLATGEQVSAGLMSLALQELGFESRSLCGWQIPIVTNEVHENAKVVGIDSNPLKAMLEEGVIPVITGFQGVHNGSITTLGRGGSDTSACAIANALGADQCLIYTDVLGVYSSDPRKISAAKIANEISYEECLEMAASGSSVIHPRAVEVGLNESFDLRILSTAHPEAKGTKIIAKKAIEREEVVGVSADEEQTLITLEDLENVPGVASAIFSQLQNININADLIVQNISQNAKYSDFSFTIKPDDEADVVAALTKVNQIAYQKLRVQKDVAKISVIGIGVKRYSEIAKKMFQTLAKQGINILLVSTSEIKISVLIQREFAQIALSALHREFVE